MHYLLETRQNQDVFFELGNEPNYPELTISGTRIAQDFQILRRALDTIPGFNGNGGAMKTRLVGPDIGMDGSPILLPIITNFTATAAKTVDAITLHYYYFKGPGAKVEQFTDLKYFNAYEDILKEWLGSIRAAAGFDVPVWIGETSDSYSYGTPNITNRYVSGFLWLDKLGVSARNGVKLVARQDMYGGNYPLIDEKLYPNPDYWLSHIFKRLVGNVVFHLPHNPNMPQFRYYAHGTCVKGEITTVTFFALNLSPNMTVPVSLRNLPSFDSTVDVYLLTPGEGGLLSQTVLLNGVPLKLIDDATLPQLTPKVVPRSNTIQFPPHTFGFLQAKLTESVKC